MEADIKGIFELDIVLLALLIRPFQEGDETGGTDNTLVKEFDDVKMT
jgi:hypothetical protein